MTASSPGSLDVDAFERDGFVHLRGVVPAGLVDDVLEELRRLPPSNRVMDAWRVAPAVRSLACHPPILAALEQLYRRRPIPFQTLDFRSGTEQRVHSDDVHFDSRPPGLMCGVWVALEDVGHEQGPLRYHPGSHRGRLVTLDEVPRRGGTFDYAAYEDLLQQRLDAARLPVIELEARRGDAFVWAASLAHGGAPVLDPDSTRWSQVTHYFFEGCIYVTPMLNDADTGAEWIREPLVDVRSGREVRHMADGRPVRLRHVAGGRSIVLTPEATLPPQARAASWARGVVRRSRRRLGARIDAARLSRWERRSR